MPNYCPSASHVTSETVGGASLSFILPFDPVLLPFSFWFEQIGDNKLLQSRYLNTEVDEHRGASRLGVCVGRGGSFSYAQPQRA